MTLTFHHIQLAIPVGGEDLSRKFWSDLIGLREIERPKALQSNPGAWFQIGTTELHIGVETPFEPAKKAHPAFMVSDVDALAAKLDPVIWDTNIPNRRRFFTTDPHGNRLEFIQDGT